jgi:DNA-binding NarL/FixJ family response regulator
MVDGEPPSEGGGGTPGRPRVLIIDGQRLFAEGLAEVLVERGLDVVAVESRAQRAVATARAHAPDVVLIDLELSEVSGLTVGRHLEVELPAARLIGLSSFADPSMLIEAVRGGFRGLVNRRATVGELVSAIEAALHSHIVLPMGAVQRLVAPDGPVGAYPRWADARNSLTWRQRDILQYLADGLSTREIAARLDLSPNTVRAHIRNILAKLRVRSRIEAVVLAQRGRLER